MEHPKNKNNTSVNMSSSSQIKDLKNKYSINDNKSNEIESLKKEIADLKSQREQDKKNIDELKLLFQTEINKLQSQIKSLTDEIASIKAKKDKKENKNNNNNINNDNNINNIEEDDINMEEEKEENDNKYSLQCLSRKLNVDIIQGTDKASIDIAIKNNSNEKYPENTCLICDKKNSLLLCEQVELGELEPNQQKVITVWFKNLKSISKGEYKCFIKLMVENVIYSSSYIELTVNVIHRPNFQNNNIPNNLRFNNNPIFENNINNLNIDNRPNPFIQNNLDNDNIVPKFRETFQLYDYEGVSDERIKNALMLNNNDFNKAFESLFN